MHIQRFLHSKADGTIINLELDIPAVSPVELIPDVHFLDFVDDFTCSNTGWPLRLNDRLKLWFRARG